MTHFIKICGITSKEDAQMVEAAGADALGFILHEESERFIEIDKAVSIAESIKNDLDIFLVFVNKDQEFIEECLDKIPHAIPQLHGEEDTEFCSKFTQGFVKAVRVNEETDFEEINRNFADAKMLLLDSHEEGSYGGTGQPFNWDLIDAQLKIPFLLAGGIDTMNVERAISSVPCKGVDVSTGVESAPGIKDPVKVRSLIENVRRFDV
ncbi:MAG TPA: phosphoribosylanthranilate isomerase [SAR86 cluster bacterium]|jgi:phosphoribosylanthranilate isomerase|nr:phosphoribosylanthranilate isomerase [SAR86 cluster bacterium]|tara:strand:+ start:588 stop:1211 length:624 start_codon:yes stop_codon:yes gene_type:complete